MNKRINDTYFALNGEKFSISPDTVTETENSVIKSVLSKLESNPELPIIEKISFASFDDAIISKLRESFSTKDFPAGDAYALVVENGFITVYANTLNGRLYGASAIRSHYKKGIPSGMLLNIPLCHFRTVKNYLPAEKDIDEFKQYIDMCMFYGYNTLMIEVGGAMVYDRHPEINEFWVNSCKQFYEYSGKTFDVQLSVPWGKNSIHIENGGGKCLSHDAVRDIVAYAKERGFDVVPEVPSLSHSDYLLAGRTDFAEQPNDPYPDTYCPSNPKSYEILFDVLDEVIDVFQPTSVNIGHDEWYNFCLCDKCKDKNPAELYAEDIRKIYNYLASKGVKTIMWGEKLINSHFDTNNCPCGGAHSRLFYKPNGKKTNFNGKELDVYESRVLLPTQSTEHTDDETFCDIKAVYPAIGLIPKDILALNWYYQIYRNGDTEYHENSIPVAFGNFSSYNTKDWYQRIKEGYKGVCISDWGGSNFRYLQRKGLLFDIAYASMMIWNRDFSEDNKVNQGYLCANDLFNYKYGENPEGVEIIHTSNIRIKHKYFGDGGLIVDSDFRLGDYLITYTDGTAEKSELRWGDHIGPDTLITNKGTLGAEEATFTTDWMLYDGRLFYRYILPVSKEVKKVEFIPDEKYKDTVTIKSIKF